MDTMIIRDAIEALQGLSRRDGHGCHKNGLKILCSIAEGNPGMTYHLNHPGVSLNKMSMPEIDKLLEMLPENVWIWNKKVGGAEHLQEGLSRKAAKQRTAGYKQVRCCSLTKTRSHEEKGDIL